MTKTPDEYTVEEIINTVSRSIALYAFKKHAGSFSEYSCSVNANSKEYDDPSYVIFKAIPMENEADMVTYTAQMLQDSNTLCSVFTTYNGNELYATSMYFTNSVDGTTIIFNSPQLKTQGSVGTIHRPHVISYPNDPKAEHAKRRKSGDFRKGRPRVNAKPASDLSWIDYVRPHMTDIKAALETGPK